MGELWPMVQSPQLRTRVEQQRLLQRLPVEPQPLLPIGPSVHQHLEQPRVWKQLLADAPMAHVWLQRPAVLRVVKTEAVDQHLSLQPIRLEPLKQLPGDECAGPWLVVFQLQPVCRPP